MPGIADSNAELTKKVFAQHHTAITLLAHLLSDPAAAEITWLDLGCGKGQILAQLNHNIPEKEVRAKIGYVGYDLENKHSQGVEKMAEELGFHHIEVKTGEMKDFQRVFSAERKFSFVTFTNTIHELHPHFIASLIIEIILRLAPKGILYIYDMESLQNPELGAVTWDGDDFKKLLDAIFEELDCKRPTIIVQRWEHTSCSCWSVNLQRDHLQVSDDVIINRTEEVVARAVGVINKTLENKLDITKQGLESMTRFGSDNGEDQNKVRLLTDFWSLNRAIIPQVVHLNESDFREAMLSLRKQGGNHQRAFDEAARIISSLNIGVNELRSLKNQEDHRIEKCIKYNITNDHYLVMVHSEKFIYLLFVGTYVETENWLNRNRGLIISCNVETLKVTVTYITQTIPREIPGVDYTKLSEVNTPYFDRLADFNIEKLISTGSLVRELKRLDDSSSNEVILELTEELKKYDITVANLILDLIFAMREGKLNAAKARVEQFNNKAFIIQENAHTENAAIDSNVNSDRATLLTGLSEQQLKDLFSPEKFQDWMLFLHPEQKRIAESDYETPAVLTGVSGSGKTCVLVHRARYLARKYPNKRIGIMTLNRNLSHMIENLLTELCSSEERKDIQVMAVYDYFKQLVEHFGPEEYLQQLSNLAGEYDHFTAIKGVIARVDRSRFAREFDPMSSENIDDTWDIFLGQSHARDDLNEFAEYLYSQQATIDPDIYLREEFNLIRSALGTTTRKSEYLKMAREGRAILFPEKIRKLTLKLLLLWEETMLHGGVLDEESLTLALLPNHSKLRELPESLRFRSLLIDEYQDLSTLDLVLLRQIPTESRNGFFVAGDTVQRVLVKSLKLQSVGLDIIGARWERITKNYRNSRQILKAASNLANIYGGKAKMLGEEIEILDPEFAVRETGKPLALEVEVEREISEAWRLAKDCIQSQTAIPWSVCLVTGSPQKISVKVLLEAMPKDFPVKANQITGEYTRTKDTMSVGTISDIKGFEFSMVIIVGCGKQFLPNPVACKEEAWREALRLYVAMTRARDSVMMLYTGKPSEFLLAMKDELQWETLLLKTD